MPELGDLMTLPQRFEMPTARGEQPLVLHLNLDHVTVDFLDRMERDVLAIAKALALEVTSAAAANRKGRRTAKAKGRKKGAAAATPAKAATADEIVSSRLSFFGSQREKMEYWARILGGDPGNEDPALRVISSWDLTHKSEPVEPTYEFLIERPFGLLQRLYTFCIFEAGTPKKKEPKNSETSGDTSSRDES